MRSPRNLDRGGDGSESKRRTGASYLLPRLMLLTAVILVIAPSVSNAENPPPFLLKWGSFGSGTGQFNEARAVTHDAARGVVYVVEYVNHRLQKFNESGQYMGEITGFSGPNGVAVDGGGNVYVLDSAANVVKKYSASGSFLLQWGSSGTGNGQFSSPNGIAADGSGNVYVADTWNGRLEKFTSSGAFVTKWGSPGAGDGQFNWLVGVAADPQGNVYTVDSGSYRVQKFTSSGSFVTKWGSLGSGDGQFRGPYGIAADEGGNIYVADTGNQRIQKFTSSGTLLCKWGGAGSGNGQFSAPQGVAAHGGKIFVADTNNYRIQEFGAGLTPVLSASWGRMKTLYLPTTRSQP